ncbi:MAG: SNF2-related protein [Dehalococcoidia bacterium]|nr:SNF2-related protein [Dehalococcoidia bacterium]
MPRGWGMSLRAVRPDETPTLRIDPSRERDWYEVSWRDVRAATGLEVWQLPGVREPKRGGDAPSQPRLIHRTHLPLVPQAVGPCAESLLWGPVTMPIWTRLHPVLRAHQVVERTFIQSRRGTLLTSEMRCGKTATVIYSHDPEAGQLLVVAPPIARLVWHEWAAKRFGACGETECSTCLRVGAVPAPDGVPSFMALATMKPDPAILAQRARVLFATYATVRPWSDVFHLFRLGTLALDEGHLAGVSDRKNKTVEAVRCFNTIADRCVIASATPMWGTPVGLWPILDIVTPGAFGKFHAFGVRYCAGQPHPHGWTYDGSSNEAELERRLSEVMIRHRWADIARDLPPITRSVEVVPISDRERARIDMLAVEIRRATGGVQTMAGNLARLRRLYADVKRERAVALAREHLEAGRSVIVWTWHEDMAERVTADLGAVGCRVYGPVHGKLPPGRREALVEGAAKDGGARAFVGTMAAAGKAISLAWAQHQVFAELDYAPLYITQSEMRPFDGTHPVESTLLVADCESDRRLIDTLLPKLETAGALGLKASVGDVASVLAGSFRMSSDEGDLNDLAERLLAGG